ncbi:MAG: Gfo/Idh/MocA family protein [Planctomycetaceae bacterium]
MTPSRTPTTAPRLDRREFLQGSIRGSIAAAAAAACPAGAFAGGSDSIKVGLVGCGGRGVGAAAQAAAADPAVQIVALGDMFRDQVGRAAETLSATHGRQFAPACLLHGPDAGELVIQADVDAVILATPPCFRPSEIAAAVRAGRHVYAEPPIGVDEQGILTAAELVATGLRLGLSLAGGLHSRHHEPARSAVAGVAAGGIGRPLRGIAIHRLGLPWRRADTDDLLRNWIHHEQVSGGPLLWHHLHALDRVHWALGEPAPLAAVALAADAVLPQPAGGRQEPTVRITCAGGVTLDVGVVRRAGIDDGIVEAVVGEAGTLDLRKQAGVGGHAASMASFIRSLRGGPRTDLAAACRSTRLASLVRAAAAAGGETIPWNRDPWTGDGVAA